MAKYRTLNVDVDIDYDEVMSELSDEDILAEVKSRKLQAKCAPDDPLKPQPYVMDYFELAFEALLQGRSADALALLDRGLFPTGAEKTETGEIKYRHALA